MEKEDRRGLGLDPLRDLLELDLLYKSSSKYPESMLPDLCLEDDDFLMGEDTDVIADVTDADLVLIGDDVIGVVEVMKRPDLPVNWTTEESRGSSRVREENIDPDSTSE